MVTEECALVLLSLQSTEEEHNQADSKSFFESEVKKIAWAEHTSLSHSINKSLSQSKSKNFSQVESKGLPHPDSKGQYLIEASGNAHLEKKNSQPKVVTFTHPEKSPAETGNKNAPHPEKYLAGSKTGNIPEPEKSPTHSGKKSMSQMIYKSLSLSEFGGDEGDEARHSPTDQVYWHTSLSWNSHSVWSTSSSHRSHSILHSPPPYISETQLMYFPATSPPSSFWLPCVCSLLWSLSLEASCLGRPAPGTQAMNHVEAMIVYVVHEMCCVPSVA